MTDYLHNPEQCTEAGCAAALLAHLRSFGVQFSCDIRHSCFDVHADSVAGIVAVHAHDLDITEHADRIAMLLWDEVRGLN